MTRFLNQIHHNGIALGSMLIFWRIHRKIFSKFFALILNADALDIGPGCRIKGLRYIKFGSEISIYRNAWIEAVYQYRGKSYRPEIVIGDRVTMSSNVHISCVNKVCLGSDVLLGSNIYISDHNHGIYNGEKQSDPFEPPSQRTLNHLGCINIGNKVWIGDNAVIIGSVKIGDGSIIAANSVVLSDVESGCIVVGAPARVVKKFDVEKGKWRSVYRNNKENAI